MTAVAVIATLRCILSHATCVAVSTLRNSAADAQLRCGWPRGREKMFCKRTVSSAHAPNRYTCKTISKYQIHGTLQKSAGPS